MAPMIREGISRRWMQWFPQECQTAVLANVDTSNKNGRRTRSGAWEICMRWMEWKGNLSLCNQREWCSSCPFPTWLNEDIGPGPSQNPQNKSKIWKIKTTTATTRLKTQPCFSADLCLSTKLYLTATAFLQTQLDEETMNGICRAEDESSAGMELQDFHVMDARVCNTL